MNRTLRRTTALLGAGAALMLGAAVRADAPIRVLVIDGQNNHNWQATTPVLRKLYGEAGRFEVTVATTPPAGGDMSTFRPDFGAYQVVVSNYNGDPWPAEVQRSLERYVGAGGGLVVVHAANNAFAGWAAWNEMIGIGGWDGRDERCGPLWYFRDDRLVRDDSPGRGGAHPGGRLPFRVTLREPEHPIVRGLPPVWIHHTDELYATLRGPGKNMTVLATGFSDPERGGSGTNRDEPVLMVLSYGKGRVFHTALGHDPTAMSSVDFGTTLVRGTEWAATGQVTQPVPDDFPTAGAVSYRYDIASMDPAFRQPAAPARPTPAGPPLPRPTPPPAPTGCAW